MKYRRALILLVLIFPGFSSPGRGMKTEFYYNLNMLKDSRPPEVMKMVMFKNISTSSSQLTRGVLFTYKNRKSTQVRIAGDFTAWESVEMTRGNNGVWFYFHSLGSENDESRVKYKFNVDGIWTRDPRNPESDDDGIGSYVSVFQFPGEGENSHVTFRMLQRNLVEFRIHRPAARYVSVVGDFNNWNPENDLLVRGSNGIWRLTKHLPRGKYLYKFVIDGKWTPDLYNSRSASDVTGEICSVLKIE